MTLGERCDEIVRLIDETLVAVVADTQPDADVCPADAELVRDGRRTTEAVVHYRRWRGRNVSL